MADETLQNESVSQLFDGNTIAPQFAIALKLFLSKTAISGRSHGSSNTSIAGTAFVKLDVLTNDWANGVQWDASHYRFNIQVAGYYQVNGAVSYTNTLTDEGAGVYIYKNGTKVAGGEGSISASSEGGMVVSDILSCSPGDYIELYTYHSGSTRSILNDATLTFLSLHKL